MGRNRLLAMASAIGLAGGMASPALAQDYFIGQLIEAGWGFCPRNFAETNGQLLAINTNTALFSLLGTQYGGNGQTTFALPDIRGRMILNQGQGPGLSNFTIGEVGGVESQILAPGQLASHTHDAGFQTVNAAGNNASPFRDAFAVTSDFQYQTNIAFDGALHAQTLTVQQTGGSSPVANMSPFIVTRYCIALAGIFPSRN